MARRTNLKAYIWTSVQMCTDDRKPASTYLFGRDIYHKDILLINRLPFFISFYFCAYLLLFSLICLLIHSFCCSEFSAIRILFLIISVERKTKVRETNHAEMFPIRIKSNLSWTRLAWKLCRRWRMGTVLIQRKSSIPAPSLLPFQLRHFGKRTWQRIPATLLHLPWQELDR